MESDLFVRHLNGALSGVKDSLDFWNYAIENYDIYTIFLNQWDQMVSLHQRLFMLILLSHKASTRVQISHNLFVSIFEKILAFALASEEASSSVAFRSHFCKCIAELFVSTDPSNRMNIADFLFTKIGMHSSILVQLSGLLALIQSNQHLFDESKFNDYYSFSLTICHQNLQEVDQYNRFEVIHDTLECLKNWIQSRFLSLNHFTLDSPSLCNLVLRCLHCNNKKINESIVGIFEALVAFKEEYALHEQCADVFAIVVNSVGKELRIACAENFPVEELFTVLNLIDVVFKFSSSQLLLWDESLIHIPCILIKCCKSSEMQLYRLCYEIIDRNVRFETRYCRNDSFRIWSEELFLCIFQSSMRPYDSYDEIDEDWIVLREQVLANILESCVQFLGKSAFEKLFAMLGDVYSGHQGYNYESLLYMLRVNARILTRKLTFSNQAPSAQRAFMKAIASPESSKSLNDESSQLTHSFASLYYNLIRFRSFSNPFEIIESCRIIGKFSTWLAKGKLSDECGMTMSQLFRSSLEFVFSYLDNSCVCYDAGASFSSLCASNHVAMVQDPMLMEILFPPKGSWSWLAMKPFQNNLSIEKRACYFTIFDWSEDNDEILECKKHIFQGICNLLQDLKDETLLYYVEICVSSIQAHIDHYYNGMELVAWMESDVAVSIELLGILVRSIKSTNSKNHPSMLIARHCGGLFRRIFASHRTVGGIVKAFCFLFTSLITFTSCVLQDEDIPAFVQFLWFENLSNAIFTQSLAIYDVMEEFVVILGPLSEKGMCNYLTLHDHSHWRDFYSDQTSMESVIFQAISQQLNQSMNFLHHVEDSSLLLPLQSSIDTKSDFWEAFFKLLKTCVNQTPLVLFSQSWMPMIGQETAWILQNRQEIELLRYAILYCSSLFNLHYSLGSSSSVGNEISSRSQLLWPQLLPLVQELCGAMMDTLLPFLLAGLVERTLNESLLDPFVLLLHSILTWHRYCLMNNLSVSSYLGDYYHQFRTTNSSSCSDETNLMLLELCLSFARSKNNASCTLTSNDLQQFVELQWQVCRGQKTLEVLQEFGQKLMFKINQ